LKYPFIKQICGIATEPVGGRVQTHDIVASDTRVWGEEDFAMARQLNDELTILNLKEPPKVFREATHKSRRWWQKKRAKR